MQLRLVFTLFVLSLLTACANQPTSEIDRLEQELEANPTPETGKALIQAYENAIANSTNPEEQAELLNRAAQAEISLNRFPAAADLLMRALRDYPTTEQASKNCLLLGQLYETKMKDLEMGQTVYQILAQAYPNTPEVAEANPKIPADAPQVSTKIENLGKQIFGETDGKIDFRLANNYINACELYANTIPNSDQSPELLYKGAEIARTIRSFPRALSMYESLERNYPDYEKVPLSVFLRAFTLDNDLKKFEEARTLYEAFLAKYPDHEFADPAKFLLENLGKDDSEIIKGFEEKQEG